MASLAKSVWRTLLGVLSVVLFGEPEPGKPEPRDDTQLAA